MNEQIIEALNIRDFAFVKKELAKRTKQKEIFENYIHDYLKKNKIDKRSLFKKVGLSNTYGYKILNGQKHTTNKDLILLLCISMGMNLNEIQKALDLYNMVRLRASNTREQIIILGIEVNADISIINEWLVGLNFSALNKK